MEPEALYWTCFSWSRAAWKAEAIRVVFDLVAAQRLVLARSANVQKLYTTLHQLAELGDTAAVLVAAKAKGAQSVQLRACALLIVMQLPRFDERYHHFCDVTWAVTVLPKALPAAHKAMNLINTRFLTFDVLPSLFYKHDVRALHHLIALNMCVRRAYNSYRVHAANKLDTVPVPLAKWYF
ncbi:acetyl-coenzyme-A carboxylase [Blastocladiella emersonii ATCC 22665]|nr:acetyl-coenzyme-A carboxylase [Blastocladiella emersonii ATCC 22665]